MYCDLTLCALEMGYFATSANPPEQSRWSAVTSSWPYSLLFSFFSQNSVRCHGGLLGYHEGAHLGDASYGWWVQPFQVFWVAPWHQLRILEMHKEGQYRNAQKSAKIKNDWRVKSWSCSYLSEQKLLPESMPEFPTRKCTWFFEIYWKRKKVMWLPNWLKCYSTQFLHNFEVHISARGPQEFKNYLGSIFFIKALATPPPLPPSKYGMFSSKRGMFFFSQI